MIYKGIFSFYAHKSLIFSSLSNCLIPSKSRKRSEFQFSILLQFFTRILINQITLTEILGRKCLLIPSTNRQIISPLSPYLSRSKNKFKPGSPSSWDNSSQIFTIYSSNISQLPSNTTFPSVFQMSPFSLKLWQINRIVYSKIDSLDDSSVTDISFFSFGLPLLSFSLSGLPMLSKNYFSPLCLFLT